MRLLPLLRSAIGTRALTGSADRALGRPADRTGAAVVRVLGARQLVQGAVVGRTGWHALSAGVDALHGASMLVLLVVPGWRRFAAWQAGTAALLMTLELRAGRRR